MKAVLSLILIFTSYFSIGQDSLSLSKSDSIVLLAKEQLGTPYKWATSNPGQSFDCSGFTSYVYSTVGLNHSRSSRAYGNLGESVSLENCKKGDCILFTGTAAGSTSIGHVGIVVSNDENGIQFIHCSSSKKHFGVVLTDYYNSGYPKRFHSVRRLIP
ncbi:MAG: C40 family peptidase [Crocinitomicaceae bacterium]